MWLASIYATGLKKDYLPSAWYQFRLNTGFMSLIMKHLIDEVETEVSTERVTMVTFQALILCDKPSLEDRTSLKNELQKFTSN